LLDGAGRRAALDRFLPPEVLPPELRR